MDIKEFRRRAEVVLARGGRVPGYYAEAPPGLEAWTERVMFGVGPCADSAARERGATTRLDLNGYPLHEAEPCGT